MAPASSSVSMKNDTTPLPKPSAPAGFLFVNETGGARSYKLGNRQDVRAHIRRVSAKQFHTTHKAIKARDIRLPKYTPLTTSGLDTGLSKKVEHDKNCSKSGFKLANRPATLSHSSVIGKFDDLTETIPEAAQLELISENADLDDMHGNLRVYCAACGGALSRSQARNKLLSQRGNLGLVKLKPPDIVKVLGAGRLDPFSSLPMDEASHYSHELLDHAVTYALPGLWPDEAPLGEANPLSKAWFMSSLRMPLLFHALIYSGSNHLDFMRYSNIYPNAPKPLSHKLIVIQKLNEALSDPNLATRDEVILAILILASQEVFISNHGKRDPFNSPLRSLGWLNVYGHFKFVPQHTKAVADIITMRGGLETISLHGLAEIIASGDVISATNSITKPGWPQLRRHEDLITNIRVWAVSPPRPLNQLFASAFWGFRKYGITDTMLEVFDAIGALTLAIDFHLQGKPVGKMIHRTRTAIQHKLLLLPTLEELNLREQDWDSTPNVYECCRLAALIYGVAVVYPVPNSHDPLQELVRRLKKAYLLLDVLNRDLDSVLLWILVLGGVAALDKPERSWYASELRSLSSRVGIKDWDTVEEKLESFLWLDSACGEGGQLLWDEAILTSCGDTSGSLTPEVRGASSS